MPELVLSSKDFKTLSSDTRVHIIKLLSSRNHNLTELSSKLGIALPSVKQHINVLLESGLIIPSDTGHKWKYYSLSRKGRRLLEPESSQVMVVLSSSLIGVLGVALILASLFGSALYSAGSSSYIAGPSPDDRVLSATVPIVTEAAIERQAAASGSSPNDSQARPSSDVSSSAVQPRLSGFFGFNPAVLGVVGALLLALAFVFYLKKTKSFR